VGIMHGLFKRIVYVTVFCSEFTVSQIVYVICCRRAVVVIVRLKRARFIT